MYLSAFLILSGKNPTAIIEEYEEKDFAYKIPPAI